MFTLITKESYLEHDDLATTCIKDKQKLSFQSFTQACV